MKTTLGVLGIAVLAAACADGMFGPGDDISLTVDRVTLAAGSSHSCALDIDGAAWCWGSNWRGELGDGTYTDSDSPVRVSGGRVFVSISVSSWTSCGLATDGVAWCWGDNQFGQLGAGWHGEGRSASEPQRVLAPRDLVSISAGALQTCGLTKDGTGFCWGSNQRGAIGTGSLDPTILDVPTKIRAPRFRTLVSGVYTVCGVAVDRSAWCWGSPGEPVDASPSPPTRVPSTATWTGVYPGEEPNCGVTVAEVIHCWGILRYRPADRSVGPRVILHEAPIPEAIGAPPGVVELAGLCLNLRDARAQCLGWRWDGAVRQWGSHPVPGTMDFRRVTGTDINACGITTLNEIYCWQGESTPVRVPGEVSWAG